MKEPDLLTNRKPIPPYTKELMLSVCDGDREIGPLMFYIFKEKQCDVILSWMLNNGFRGKELKQMFKCRFFRSPRMLIDFVLSKAKGPFYANVR